MQSPSLDPTALPRTPVITEKKDNDDFIYSGQKKAPKKILVHITAWIRILGSSTLTLLLEWSPFIDLASPLIDYIQQGTEYPELITQNKISDLDTNLHIILPHKQ